MKSKDNSMEIQRKRNEQWFNRLRLYAEKKRRLEDEGKFNDSVHQQLIKEFRV